MKQRAAHEVENAKGGTEKRTKNTCTKIPQTYRQSFSVSVGVELYLGTVDQKEAKNDHSYTK